MSPAAPDRDHQLIKAFAGVTLWKRGTERAPHKPLLLLLALARLQRGEDRLMRFADIEDPMRRLLDDFGPPRKRSHPEYPFWRLQRDGKLWELPEREQVTAELAARKRQGDASPAILRKHRVRAGLSEEVHRYLGARPELVHRIAGMLLHDNFPASLHEDILDAVGMPWVVLDRRRRDSTFRDTILRIYERRCAVCRYDGRLHTSEFGLEAAHVKWHAAGGPDQPDNGLALCTMHHKAFDRGAMGIDDDHRILISEHVTGGDAVRQWLIDFAGKPLAAPQPRQPRPALDFIRWHRTQVFRDPARHCEHPVSR